MLMDSYIFSILYKLIYFSLSLNPAIHGMGNSPNICFGCKEQKESQPWFIFCYKLSKIFQAFQKLSRLIIKELIINLKYTFSIPFRITLKTITMGTSSQFHDGTQLKFYPHLAQRYYSWTEFKRNLCQGLELPFKQ